MCVLRKWERMSVFLLFRKSFFLFMKFCAKVVGGSTRFSVRIVEKVQFELSTVRLYVSCDRFPIYFAGSVIYVVKQQTKS